MCVCSLRAWDKSWLGCMYQSPVQCWGICSWNSGLKSETVVIHKRTYRDIDIYKVLHFGEAASNVCNSFKLLKLYSEVDWKYEVREMGWKRMNCSEPKGLNKVTESKDLSQRSWKDTGTGQHLGDFLSSHKSEHDCPFHCSWDGSLLPEILL